MFQYQKKNQNGVYLGGRTYYDASGKGEFTLTHLSEDKNFNYVNGLTILICWGIFRDAGPYYLGVILTICGIFDANYFY